ncbi:uncharacterized protein FIBRA_08845 [Fibroporia radiculosa]|uniref:Uncharacterized protein n=1 Tax=Fibroporia radiculosa TaxID=599839 RepID=J4GID1_9APHY|nr:uncharacterized protein FIBRA_08845 [Fibroporia radiculosa]CCM06568.1 predicted protein [Fibroporia radiculosa]
MSKFRLVLNKDILSNENLPKPRARRPRHVEMHDANAVVRLNYALPLSVHSVLFRIARPAAFVIGEVVHDMVSQSGGRRPLRWAVELRVTPTPHPDLRQWHQSIFGTT